VEGTAPKVVAGRYTLQRRIGAGGMGEVFLAQDVMLDRSVAVKIVPTRVREDDHESRVRALREARAASRLSHPGAVTIHDIAEDENHLYIVMELVRAPDLSALVRSSGPLPPDRAATIGLDLLHVLEAAHAAGITHRDVKPSNVMVLPGDRVKLTDFGIASIQDDTQLTASGSVMGSPAYMSPEQAGGRRAGPAADLWGLGASLYYAVEGRAPYDRVSAVAVAAAVLTQPPDDVVLAGPLGPVIMALMSRQPQDRPDPGTARRLLTDVASGAATAQLSVDLVPTRREDDAPGAAGPTVVAPVPLASVTATSPTFASPPEVTSPPAVAPPPTVAEPRPVDRRRLWVGWPAWAAGLVVVVAVLLGMQLLVPALRGDGSADRDPGSSERLGAAPVQEAGAAVPGSGDSGDAGPAGAARSSGSDGALAEGSQAASGVVPLTVQSGAWPGQTLPAGFASATNTAGGYRVGVPSSFDVRAAGTTTYLEWPDAMFDQVFEVRRYARGDALDRLSLHSSTFRADHADDAYAEIRFTDNWTYHGQDAAAWEFTYTRNGDKVHVREVAFSRGDATFTVLYRIKDLWWLSGGTASIPQGFEQSFALVP
jgi:tRNA A-37 threonylcarbamoyl transferase component Bud32